MVSRVRGEMFAVGVVERGMIRELCSLAWCGSLLGCVGFTLSPVLLVRGADWRTPTVVCRLSCSGNRFSAMLAVAVHHLIIQN